MIIGFLTGVIVGLLLGIGGVAAFIAYQTKGLKLW